MGETGKMGKVVAVDADGDPKVLIDGEEEAKQRFGTEFEIIEKNIRGKRSQSRSQSQSDDKKKKKKKKKKSSSSSSSPSKSSSSSSRKNKKRKSAFGKSTMELQEEAKRK